MGQKKRQKIKKKLKYKKEVLQNYLLFGPHNSNNGKKTL